MTRAKTTRHAFPFDGGEQLTTIGATFFVSYLYYLHVDPRHDNWDRIATKTGRISTISSSKLYHRAWLERVTAMNEAKLSKNTLGLDGNATKALARAVLSVL